MLSLPSSLRIWIGTQPADLRKSFDGLARLVEERLQLDPLSGQLFVFRNKAGDRVKLLMWDGDGYAIYYKRLEAGIFRFPAGSNPADPPSGDAVPGGVRIRPADLAMLLDGVDLASVRRSKRYRRPAPTPAATAVPA